MDNDWRKDEVVFMDRQYRYRREIDALWQRCREDPEQVAHLTEASDAVLDLCYAAAVQVLRERGRLRRYLAERQAPAAPPAD